MTHNLSPQTDARGVVVSECKPSSLEDYERALYQFQSNFGDATETLAATVKNDPEFVMGHVFNASAMLMMTERQYIPAQRDILTQTLIESAICADNTGLASNLISERSVHKPFSPLTRRFNAKIKTH